MPYHVFLANIIHSWNSPFSTLGSHIIIIVSTFAYHGHPDQMRLPWRDLTLIWFTIFFARLLLENFPFEEQRKVIETKMPNHPGDEDPPKTMKGALMYIFEQCGCWPRGWGTHIHSQTVVGGRAAPTRDSHSPSATSFSSTSATPPLLPPLGTLDTWGRCSSSLNFRGDAREIFGFRAFSGRVQISLLCREATVHSGELNFIARHPEEDFNFNREYSSFNCSERRNFVLFPHPCWAQNKFGLNSSE